MIPVLSLQSASRDPERSPMQWSGEVNAGFNNKTNITWLPVHPDYTSVNVEVCFSTVLLPVNIWPELSCVYFLLDHIFLCCSFSSRSKRKMKVLFWLSTVS